jgi:hypothetical protein
MRQVGVLIQEAMREDDENDPLLESYQNHQRNSCLKMALDIS